MSVLCLYCFSTRQALNFFNPLALPQSADAAFFDSMVTLESADLVAVYRLVEAADYAEENLKSIAWLEPRACQHAALVEKIILFAPVLPVKFGTLFDSLESLQKVLTQHQSVIAKHLEILRDKREWTVKVFLNEDTAKRQLSAQDSEIADFILTMPASPGARYLQQKKLDEMLAGKLRCWINEQLKAFCADFKIHTFANAPLRLLSALASGRTESMVFNTCFLVSEDCLAQFCTQIAALRSRVVADGFVIELTGPWPAYNFCPDLRP